MEYTTLGESGLSVSRIAIGCNRFGGEAASNLDRSTAFDVVDHAIDLGINYFDTANAYTGGESEVILGEALSDYDRDWPVVSTKVKAPMDEDNPNAAGLSRKAIEQELANSLGRLGLDTIDVYHVHRWDYESPILETMKTLDDAVRRGQVRYLGASSMWTYQLARALHTSEQHGLERFATIQNHYNLAYREEEREMLPFARREGLGVTPWSPLARGFLARPLSAFDSTRRGEHVSASRWGDVYPSRGGEETNARVGELAHEYGVSMAQVALAWLLGKDDVDAVVAGVSSIEQLDDVVRALEVSLSTSDVEYLEDPYRPKPVAGHS